MKLILVLWLFKISIITQILGFSKETVKNVIKEIRKLSTKKATKSNDIPVKIFKKIIILISDFSTNALIRENFHLVLKIQT